MKPVPFLSKKPAAGRLLEVVLLFLRLGATGFGGPAAHIAMMHDETVKRRKWLDDQQFLDMLGATNLIPGPNSTEMAIHIGFLRAGWAGLILGGVSFILPAAAIVMLLAWVYVRWGSTPQLEWVLYGIKPVVIALITKALWDLGRKAVKSWLTALAGLAALALFFLGFNEIALLFLGGIAVMAFTNLDRLRKSGCLYGLAPLAGLGLPAVAAVPFSLLGLFLTFLKIGTVLFGGGYVLLAFLRADFVIRLGWLTDQQLVDAIAIGQVTPGPLFTSATFIGYLLGGVSGAMLATLGIFLPSFFLVALSNPFIPRLRNSRWFSGLLDGVNATALGLMAAVSLQIGRAALIDIPTVLLAAAAAVLLFRARLNSTWLILGGAFAGIIIRLLA